MRRAGFTLLEAVVVLALLGILGAVAGLAWRSAGPGEDAGGSAARDAALQARRRAVASGRPVHVTLDGGAGLVRVTALPDGRLLGATALGLDELRGRAADVPLPPSGTGGGSP